jgi:hypothetical protein
MSEALVYRSFVSLFGLTDPVFSELISPLPDSICEPARYWTVLALIWPFSKKIRSKFGEDIVRR